MRTRTISLGLLALVVSSVLLISSSSESSIVNAQNATSTAAVTNMATSAATSVATNAATSAANQSAKANGYISIFHAALGAPNVDVYLNGKVQVTNLAYQKAMDFVSVPSDTYQVEVRTTGKDASTKALSSETIVVAPGVSDMIMAMGTLNGAGVQAFKVKTFEINRAPTNGKARFMVIHAAPDTPVVDILQGGQPVLTIIKYAHMSDAALNLDPGKYDFAVVPTGKTTPPVSDLTGTTLQQNVIYIAVLTGLSSNKTLKPVILQTSSPVSSPSSGTPAATLSATAASTVSQ